MPSHMSPYLNFQSETRSAMEFYRSVLGGELELTTFAEGGMPMGPDTEELIMHSQLTTPAGYILMAADSASFGQSPQSGANAAVSLFGTDEAELRGYWDGLADGANVEMALEAAPWGDIFGQLTDRFGVRWLINISAPA